MMSTLTADESIQSLAGAQRAGKASVPISWKRIFLTVAAIVLISIGGAAAIWYIHATTPSAQTLQVDSRNSARLPGTKIPLTVVDRPAGATAEAGAISGRVTMANGAPQSSGAVNSPAGGPAKAGGASETLPGSAAKTGVGSASNVTGLAPPPGTVPANGKPAPVQSGNLSWAPADRVRPGAEQKSDASAASRPANVGPIGTTSAPASIPMSPPPAAISGAGVPPATSATNGNATAPAPSANQRPVQVAAERRADPPVTSPSLNLGQLQEADCAGKGTLGRFLCNEKVRLQFCRDRWNQHPDCTAPQPTRDP